MIVSKLIVDTRRSRLNSCVDQIERIVWLRLTETVRNVISLLVKCEDNTCGAVLLAVVDFVDTFQTLGVHTEERRHIRWLRCSTASTS